MMEENVALDSTKQKKFAKSIKGIKNLLKKNEKSHKPAVLAPKDGVQQTDKKKRKRKDRGLVYLSHIPHGFYEYEMTQYFKQFGMVTNVRVIRSSRTGRSKGFAFVEFKEPAVAEIVAETMNNYLMGKRLIKAVIVPPEKQRHHAFRKRWTAINNPTAERRRKLKKVFNANKDEAGDLQKARALYKVLEKKKKKFRNLGLDIDFFTPVDVPGAMFEHKAVKPESESEDAVKDENSSKKKNKMKGAETVKKLDKKEPKTTKQIKTSEVKSKKEVKKEQENNKLRQNEKEKKLKDTGVQLPENFIKIQPESGEERDSSIDFDSDEYDKMLENESDVSSGDEENDASENEDSDSSKEEDQDVTGEELSPVISIKPKKGKKPVADPQPKKSFKAVNNVKEHKTRQVQLQRKVQAQDQSKKPQAQLQKKPQNQGQLQKNQQYQGKPHKKSQPQGQKQNEPQPPGQVPINVNDGKGVKRKNTQPEIAPKKPKFEKQDKKQRNKQFKKKNKVNN